MKDSYVWHKDKLKGDYLKVFDKVELYGQTGSMDPLTYEERMMDLVDMFITAQDKGRSVQKIIGTDVEEFCGEYFGEYTWRDRMKKLPRRMLPFAWFLFVFAVPDVVALWSDMEPGSSFWNMKTDVSGLMFGFFWGLFASVVLGVLIKPLVFKIKWLSTNMYAIVTLVIVIGGILVFADRMPQLQAPVWISLLFAGGYLVLYYIGNAWLNYKKHGTIKSREEVSKISFWGKVNEGMEVEVPKAHKKRFEKKNQKLAKQNKPLISEEEYMESFRKEVVIDKKGSLISTIVLAIIVVVVGVTQMIQSGLVDGGLFLIFLLLIEIPLLKWCWSGYKKNPREIVLNRCEELGMNIIEYARGLEDGTIK